MDSSILLVDEDLRYREVAGELFERMSHAADDIAGQRIGDVFPSEPAETLRERYSVALQGELSTFSLDCWETEFQVQTAPIRNVEGDITGAIGLFLDSSNWRWYANALDSLGQWNTELLETKSEDELFETLLEITTERLHLFGATVYRFDEETATLTPEATSIERPVPDPVEPGDHIVWETFKRNAIIRDEDVQAPLEQSTSSRKEYRFAVPFGSHGVFTAYGVDEERDDESSVKTVQMLCVTVAIVLDRIKYRDQLRERERERQQRSRKLEQTKWTMETFRDIIKAAISAGTIEELDIAICDRIVQDESIEFAWIGELNRSDMEIAPRAWAGEEDGYLERMPIELETDDGPTARTVRHGDVTLLGNLARDIEDDHWRSRMLERGFRSVMAIPLSNNGILQGVLTMYANRPNAFDELAHLATDLGQVVGYATTALQCKNALTSETATELEIEITAPVCFFVRFVRETGTSVSFESITTTEDGMSLVYATAEEPDLLVKYAENAVVTESARLLEQSSREVIEVKFEDSFIGSFLSMHGINLERASATPEEVRITVSIPSTMTPRQALHVIKSKYPNSMLLAKREHSELGAKDATEHTFFDRLTQRQREVVEHAYNKGYFETPKEVTGKELAESMGISDSSFHNHLRAAESQLFSWLFDTAEI